MQKAISFEKRLYEFKRLISILEWDIPHIQNNQLKAIESNKRRTIDAIQKRTPGIVGEGQG